MANGTPESEFSIECFQNYSAGEVFVQGLAGVVDQTDVEALIRAQKTIAPAPPPAVTREASPLCSCCRAQLQEPYIECSECEATVCTACYSAGKETSDHRSNHGYWIRKNDFPIFDNCSWTAKEEIELLNALTEYGYGNWGEISKSIQTRSELECEEHYKKYYIDNVQYEELKLLPHTTQSMFPQPLIPFLESEKSGSDLSRCPKYCNRNLAGYNAYRSDFNFNYDNNAEKILDVIAEIDYEDELVKSLTIAVGNGLNTRLRERKRRYDVMKQHGLILSHRMVAWVQRFDGTLGRQFTERMFPFMQLLTGMQFDALLERLNLEQELSQKIARLYEYRRNGIKTLHGARLYKRLKRNEEEQRRELKRIAVKIEKSLPMEVQIYDKSIPTNPVLKSKATPKRLEIEDLPGYHSLNNAEKDMCASIRLLPQKYLEIREQLIAENCKLGFLRLLDARKIVRIDVNKTRKVYDYLVKEGFVKKPC